MPFLKSQGVLMGNGAALYVPADAVQIDVSGATFPNDVTVGNDLYVDGTATVTGLTTLNGAAEINAPAGQKALVLNAASGQDALDISGTAVVSGQLGCGNLVATPGGAFAATGYDTTSGSFTTTSGNITTSSGNITTLTGYMNQGDVNIGTNYINVDNIGNPNIQVDAKEGGDGQAYFDLITQKLTTSTNLHRVRSIVGNTGAYTLFHQTGAPGPLTSLQSMNWSADGTVMQFSHGGTPALQLTKPTLGPSFATAPGFTSVYGQNQNIAVNALTTIFQLTAAQFGGFATYMPITLKFFPGDLTTDYGVTYIMTISKLNGNLGVWIENQATADAGLPPGWALTVAGGGTPTISINVTTGAVPIGASGQYCNYAATFLSVGVN